MFGLQSAVDIVSGRIRRIIGLKLSEALQRAIVLARQDSLHHLPAALKPLFVDFAAERCRSERGIAEVAGPILGGSNAFEIPSWIDPLGMGPFSNPELPTAAEERERRSFPSWSHVLPGHPSAARPQSESP